MIAISAGHHPSAKGASNGCFNEHDEAVIWANYIVDHLDSKAVLVPIGFLKNKVNFINSDASITLAVEIHFNSVMGGGASGSETLYFPGSVKGREVASIVQSELGRIFQPDRGIKEGYYQMNVDKGPDFFLARTKCVSIIIEPDFIQNEGIIKQNRLTACQAIAGALLQAEEVTRD